MGGGESPSSMLSHKQRKQAFQGPESNKALITAYAASQEKQHKERLEHDKEMQKMQCETMLKMQAMQNQHAMQMQMQMMASLGSVVGLGGGRRRGSRHVADGGSGGDGGFVAGGVGSSADSIFTEGDSLDSETGRHGLLAVRNLAFTGRSRFQRSRGFTGRIIGRRRRGCRGSRQLPARFNCSHT